MTETTIPNGYRQDSKGRLVPEHLVKDHELLEDQTVEKIHGYAAELSARIGRFKGHTFDDVASFVDVLREKFGARRGGAKGNVTLTSYDGCHRVIIQVQDNLVFGPELQVAKELFDECVTAWSAEADPKVKALVDHAFQVDKAGQINRAALFGLRRLNIDDPKWQAAITALDESIKVLGSREYIRIQRRATPRDRWETIPVDLASCEAPASAKASAGRPANGSAPTFAEASAGKEPSAEAGAER